MFKEAPNNLEADPRQVFKGEVAKMLKREGITVVPGEQEEFRSELEGSERYVRSVVEHREGEGEVYRFLKIPAPDPAMWRTFAREVGVNRFLGENSALRTEKIIKANTDPKAGIPFAIMEVLEREQEEIGFDEHGEFLGPREAEGFARTLRELYSVDTGKLPRELREIMETFPGKYEGVRDEILAVLEQRVRPLDAKARKDEPFHEVLSRRLGVSNFKEKVGGLLRHLEKVIRAGESGKEILVHGNLDPGNAFVHGGGNVELIDFEFTGLCKNEVAGAMVDFGNLRARAWRNKRFRNALDKAVIESYRDEGKEEVGRAVVSLGILRSHMVLAGFFENYEHGTQREDEETRRRQATEDDIAKAWEVAGIDLYDLS